MAFSDSLPGGKPGQPRPRCPRAVCAQQFQWSALANSTKQMVFCDNLPEGRSGQPRPRCPRAVCVPQFRMIGERSFPSPEN